MVSGGDTAYIAQSILAAERQWMTQRHEPILDQLTQSPSPAPADVTPAGPRQAATIFILITIALDMLALGAIIPVLPALVKSFLGGDTATASRVYGLFGTVWALMQFLFMPVLGSLSDRFGRRPIVLLSNLGLGLDYILMALAPSLWLLFVGRVISGITAASFSVASAYIADITAPEKRAAAFGMIGAAFGIGFICGPAIGGILGELGPRVPFWAAAGLSLLNFAYGWFVLPESLAPDKRSPFKLRNANPIGALRFLRSVPGLLPLSFVNFLSFLAHEVLPSTTVLYIGFRYGLGTGAIGMFLAAVGLASALMQSLGVRPLVKRFGEARVLIGGLIAGAMGFAVYGLAPSAGWFALGIPLVALWGTAGPAVQALMTAKVGPTQQGQLQGALSSLRGVSGLIGPGLFTLTFAQFIGDWRFFGLPGAPFLAAALLLALGALWARLTLTQARAAS